MSCSCEPIVITITSLGPQTDDLRLSVNNTRALDPRCNVRWYRGAATDRGNAAFNPDWATAGYRTLVFDIERDLHARYHCRAVPGARIGVDVFVGWQGVWRTSPWVADVVYPNGMTATFYGGQSATGLAPPSSATIAVDVFGAASSFGNFAAGWYRVTYVSGAAQYGAGLGWQLRRGTSTLPRGPRVYWSGGSEWLGNDSSYPTIAAAEAGNAGVSVDFSHGGGAITMDFFDNNFLDNAGGPIVFAIQPLGRGPYSEIYVPNGGFTLPCPPKRGV